MIEGKCSNHCNKPKSQFPLELPYLGPLVNSCPGIDDIRAKVKLLGMLGEPLFIRINCSERLNLSNGVMSGTQIFFLDMYS